MASQDFLVTRYYAAEPTVGRVYDDQPVAIRLKDKAAGTSTPTVTFSNTSSTLTIVDSDATSTAIDLSAAAYDTIGELADYINGLSGWSCKVLDALRADASNDVFVNGSVSSATSAEGETVFDCKLDTSAALSYTYRISYDRGIATNKPKGSHRVKLYRVMYYANVNAATANAVRIYKWDAAAKTETQIWGAPSVDATETTHTFTNLITAGDGNDLIVRVLDATSLTDNTSGYLQCEFTKE